MHGLTGWESGWREMGGWGRGEGGGLSAAGMWKTEDGSSSNNKNNEIVVEHELFQPINRARRRRINGDFELCARVRLDVTSGKRQ